MAIASATSPEVCQFSSLKKYESVKIHIVDWYKLHPETNTYCDKNPICDYPFTPLVMAYDDTPDKAFQQAKHAIISACGTYSRGICCDGSCPPSAFADTQICNQNITRISHLPVFIVVIVCIVIVITAEFSRPVVTQLLPTVTKPKQKRSANRRQRKLT